MSEKKPVTLPELIGDKIYLKPATSEHVANTHHWYLASDPSKLNPGNNPILTAAEAVEAFKKELGTGYGQRFVAMTTKGNDLVAWISYFDINERNRSARLDFIVDPDFRRKGYAVEVVRLLCRYLFRSLNMNRVTAQVCSLNTAAVAMLEKAGFKKEGTLRHEYFYDGEFYDGYIYSMLLFEFER